MATDIKELISQTVRVLCRRDEPGQQRGGGRLTAVFSQAVGGVASQLHLAQILAQYGETFWVAKTSQGSQSGLHDRKPNLHAPVRRGKPRP